MTFATRLLLWRAEGLLWSPRATNLDLQASCGQLRQALGQPDLTSDELAAINKVLAALTEKMREGRAAADDSSTHRR